MRVIWSKTKGSEGQEIYRGRYGLIHMEYDYPRKGGDMTYRIFLRAAGRRINILTAPNPAGKDQIDARVRCEHIGACLDNYLNFELLPNEINGGGLKNTDKLPRPGKLVEVDGVFINRVYRYEGSRGVNFYRVFSVMNTTAESWGNLIGYRNILTGDDYGRPLEEFTPAKYKLMAIGDLINNPHDFKRTTINKLGK